jgi:hypothetical protein
MTATNPNQVLRNGIRLVLSVLVITVGVVPGPA